MEGWTDGHDEINSHFLHFCECAQITLLILYRNDCVFVTRTDTPLLHVKTIAYEQTNTRQLRII